MNPYITAAAIKRLREEKYMTQAQLAERIGVSDKAVSKWETGKGLPDITLVEPLARALGVSVMELMSGDRRVNNNRSANVLRTMLNPAGLGVNLRKFDAVRCNQIRVLVEYDGARAGRSLIQRYDILHFSGSSFKINNGSKRGLRATTL